MSVVAGTTSGVDEESRVRGVMRMDALATRAMVHARKRVVAMGCLLSAVYNANEVYIGSNKPEAMRLRSNQDVKNLRKRSGLKSTKKRENPSKRTKKIHRTCLLIDLIHIKSTQKHIYTTRTMINLLQTYRENQDSMEIALAMVLPVVHPLDPVVVVVGKKEAKM